MRQNIVKIYELYFLTHLYVLKNSYLVLKTPKKRNVYNFNKHILPSGIFTSGLQDP